MDNKLLLLISPIGSFFIKIAPSSSAPKAEGLPLNTPSNGIVDQACLMKYVGCDENMKCAGYTTLLCIFFVITGTHLNGFISSSSHPIRKLFRMEEEYDFIFDETRFLSGVYWD